MLPNNDIVSTVVPILVAIYLFPILHDLSIYLHGHDAL
jgi:hypothetical protein